MPPAEKVADLPILSQTELMGGGSSAAGGKLEQNPDGTAPIFSISFLFFQPGRFSPAFARLVGRPHLHPPRRTASRVSSTMPSPTFL
jgi:hypothetical protein